MMHKRYTKEQCTAAEAQRLAQEIAFGPVVFQVSRLMLKFGIFQLLSGKREGYTLQEISGQTGLTRYAAQVLLEASLTIGTILLEEDRYVLAKAGWFLLNDKMARVNMEFNHDVKSRLVPFGRSSFKRASGRIESIRRMAYHLRRSVPIAGTGTEKLVRL